MNPQVENRATGRGSLAAAGLVLVGAAIVRFVRLDHFSYWLDEVLEARFVHGTWTEFWRDLRFDAVHPPLDYLVVRALEPFHPADWVRKIPAAVWGVGAVAAIGALLARRASPRLGLIAMLLLAAAPYHVRYSQELRPYSLGLFLLALGLLALDAFLERPGSLRLAALFAGAMACAYALYLGALVLALSGAALVVEDCFSPDPTRRRNARRFLAASPLFLLACTLSYLPWWPVLREAARRAPVAPAEPLSFERLDRTLAFFSFAPNDGYRLGFAGALAVLAMGGGAIVAARTPRLRFLLVWSLGGLAAIELLSQIHPHFDATRRFLPAGIALTVLIALAVAALADTRPWRRWVGAALLVALFAFELRGLVAYDRIGRPDWRPVADFLAREAPIGEPIFTENQYLQLCVDHYLRRHPGRSRLSVLNLSGQTRPIAWSWRSGARAWLILGCGPRSEELRRWADPFPTLSFPTAEGDTVVKRLDAAAWADSMRRLR